MTATNFAVSSVTVKSTATHSEIVATNLAAFRRWLGCPLWWYDIRQRSTLIALEFRLAAGWSAVFAFRKVFPKHLTTVIRARLICAASRILLLLLQARTWEQWVQH